MTQLEGVPRSGRFARARWLPLAWTGVALVAQLLFVGVLAPRLPSSFLVWFNADRAAPGDFFYRFATADFIVVGWIAVAVFAAAAILCAILDPARAGWTVLLALIVCLCVPLLIGLLYASIIWQLGLPAPADEIPSGIGVVALIVGVLGLVLGFGSLILGRRPATSPGKASTSPSP
jgi:hypothetical protein